MKSHRSLAFVLACLSACGLAATATPASAERVSSERSKTVSKASAPLRWRADGIPSKQVSRLQYREMPVERILKVQQYNATRRMKPMQIGVARNAISESTPGAMPALHWTATRDGGSAARIEITSPVALGLRVRLKVNSLDPRAELRFAGSDDPSRIVAMMTAGDILPRTDAYGMFSTPSTDGEKQLIEIYLPPGAPRRPARLQAPQLSHLLTNSRNDFKIIEKVGVSGSCNVDTACRVATLGPNFVSAKNAVAHMVFDLFNPNGTKFGTYICTGTLLADTVTTSQIPYFYTANHCFAGGEGGVPVQNIQTVAESLETHWKYEAASCGNQAEPGYALLEGGADYLYSDANTDGMLIRLKTPPPAGSVFAGWDSALLPTSSDIIAIHHPGGDVKKVSLGQQVSRDPSLTEVGWLSGTTEGGSSGSGLFTAGPNSYHLRGGLYGGSASCANTGSLATAANRDYYSRFDVVFPHISQWLAPTPANVAPVANFTYTVSGKTIHFTSTSTDPYGAIESHSWNFGDGTTSAAVNPTKTYASLGVYNVTLTVTDDGGLTHSITRNVSTIGRGRVNGSQPRIPREAAPVAQPATKTRDTRLPARTGPFEP